LLDSGALAVCLDMPWFLAVVTEMWIWVGDCCKVDIHCVWPRGFPEVCWVLLDLLFGCGVGMSESLLEPNVLDFSVDLVFAFGSVLPFLHCIWGWFASDA
jgi:hypothetical protein